MSESKQVILSREAGTFLKGLAIIPVVLLHLFSTLPAVVYFSPHINWMFIGLDQLGRYCVPLFVALSGYGLAISYQRRCEKGESSWLGFFWRRVSTLLPQYIWWSLAIMAMLSLANRQLRLPLTEYLWPLLFGSADYHLYFIPMIFQLYLLFPVVWWLFRKLPAGWVVAGLAGVQLLMFMVYRWLNAGGMGPDFFVNDQRQYIFSLTWILYFGLGVGLAKTGWWQKISGSFGLRLLLGGGAVGGWMSAAAQSYWAVAGGANPADMLQFTKFSIVVFAVCSILLLFSFAQNLLEPTRTRNVLTKAVLFLGKYSYLIYLSHTMILRIGAGVVYSTQSMSLLALLGLCWLGALVVSLKVIKSEG